MSLSDQISEIGVGRIPAQELPTRLSTSTPEHLQARYAKRRAALMVKLKPLLDKNAAITGFTTAENSDIDLNVAPEDEDKLFRRQYNIANAWHKSIDEIIERWLSSGKIVMAPPGCKFNSPLLAVPKKDEFGHMTGLRLCIDIRTLNQYLIENDRFQLPHIPDIIGQLSGKKLFGEVDLKEAYTQIKLTKRSRKYTAFTWMGKQYMFKACPYGIKHIPSLFQRLMNHIFADMPFVICYIDNIAWGSLNWDEHHAHSVAVIERLNSVNLLIKPTSVNVGNSQIKLLGHLITEHGVGLDPEKQDMMTAWPLPEGGQGIASFLGLGTFLRDHVRHYADLTAPLEPLKKMKVIDWKSCPHLEQQFYLVRRAFANAPFLKFPDFSKRFVGACDASHLGVGGVLYQPDDDDDTITSQNIVAICSKSMNATQQRYPIYKKELYALVYSLRKFHTYIYGKRDVKFYTDHKPLIHILTQRVMSQALQQYVDVIADYDLIIKYRPGIMHVLPDALSRMYKCAYEEPDTVWGTLDTIRILDRFSKVSSPSDFVCQRSIDDITPIKVLKKRHQVVSKDKQGEVKRVKTIVSTMFFCSPPSVASLHAMTHAHTSDNYYKYDTNAAHAVISNDDLYEFDLAILHAPLFSCGSDLSLRAVTARMNMCRPIPTLKLVSPLHVRIQQEKNEMDVETPLVSTLLTDDELLAIAQDKRGKRTPSADMKQKLVAEAHLRGHFGEKAMLRYIDREGFWWPAMRADITKEIRNCDDCVRFTTTHVGYEPARSITASQPGDHYQMDLAQLPKAIDGSMYILVLVDVFTGFVMLRSLKHKDEQTTATALWEIFATIGLPKILQSDNGGEFFNKTLAALCRLVGVPHRFISAYNPRSDGKVERTVQTVKHTIVKLLHGATALWPSYLPFAQLMYNTKVQEITGSTPFSLMFGRKLNDVKDYTRTPSVPISVEDWKQHQDRVVSLIFPSIVKRVDARYQLQRKALNKVRKHILADTLPKGTLVMILDPTYIASPHVRPTTTPLYVGPYSVVQRTLHGPYILRDADGVPYARHVPVDQMKILFAPDESGAPKLDPSFEVETIVDARYVDGKQCYKVKWKGYPVSQCTWETDDKFDDFACIEDYWKRMAIEKQEPLISMMIYTHSQDL